ncbi:DNA ligase 1 [Heracleum sosnowskyi]|uniref:DNA ligase 1 n=1 Tax=Heracleum sosnowskyi TaxID=360622 RepID=A0AAD8J6F1_9APIA|nr:DNA ligase 1 [Heracleum sosnowskyi]
MDKPDDQTSIKQTSSWGTWEELLLAFAVNRYGTSSWDSVSFEVSKRCSTLTSLTPLNCMLRFNHLKLRYKDFNNNNDDDNDNSRGDNDAPWLDDLRNRRIAELKNELEHYDLSIVSLQSKVKRLKEEREGGFRGCDEKLDGKNGLSEVKLEEFLPEKVIEEEVGGKDEKLETVRTESCNGSTDSISKEMGKMEMVKREEEVGGDELVEVCEMVAESKKLGEIEGSDVQSTTSRLRKEENEKLCFGSGVDAGRENESLLLKEMSSVSQPLIEFLEILQSYKLSLVSERLLDSQETSNYRNLIRQHIDIKSVYRNVGSGCYSESEHKFFRDLLLLVNNAILLFEKNTSESNAATELRQYILEKMAHRDSKADLSAGKQTSVQPMSLLSDQAQEPSDSWQFKSGIEGIARVSRKRSSIAARGSISSSSGSDRKSLQAAAAAAAMHKPVVESKQITKSPAADRRRQIIKRRTTNGCALNSRSSKKNSKDLASTTCDEDPAVIISNQTQGKLGSPTKSSQFKGEVRNAASTEMARSAANFLDRLSQSPPPNNELFVDALKNSMCIPHRGGKPKQKGSRGIKGGSRMEKVTKSSCEEKLLNEESSLTRRQLGRPPKRAAAPTPVLAGPVKCSRTTRDIDAETPKQPKKRSRK